LLELGAQPPGAFRGDVFRARRRRLPKASHPRGILWIMSQSLLQKSRVLWNISRTGGAGRY
ncbi:MAG: hypothetical protein ACREQ5_15530, partial [Candidatus Dormibacteria bacterium]